VDGIIQISLSQSFPKVGTKNLSEIHWDIVEDLRQVGRLELDGEVVRETGRWRL